MPVRNSRLFAGIFLGGFLLHVCGPVQIVKAEDADDDALSFVTDEQSGALYECNPHGCTLVARPLQPANNDSDCSSDGTCGEQIHATVRTPSVTCHSKGTAADGEVSCI